MSPEPNLFPLGVATGSAHCNRKEERAELTRNVLTGAHTWLWGRRRMGKTSLVEQGLQDLARNRRKVVAATIDLLVVHDVQDLEVRIRTVVERISASIVPKGRRSSGKLAEAFGALKPEFSFGAMGLGVRLSPPTQAMQGIAEMLLGLDRAAGMYRRRAVIVLDEFQQLGQLESGTARHGPEGAVRHAVERARNVTYLFAGSQRHLLASMFEDEDRPLYRLCRKMTLDRIGAADYRAFMRQAGISRWRSPVADAAIDRILAATTRHPYYVNALCARLWGGERPPSVEAVDAAWSRIVDEDKRVAADRLVRLAPSQRALLKAVARTRGGVEHPASLEFLSPLRLPTSTGNRARVVLEQEDLIRRDDDGRWVLVDPVMTSYLRSL